MVKGQECFSAEVGYGFTPVEGPDGAHLAIGGEEGIWAMEGACASGSIRYLEGRVFSGVAKRDGEVLKYL